ncbi:hypothetical protein JH06_0130 [Blastocystis sp. subtype 4]|uniref:hypothetical protein n=1 Tax=Blastocystis sp. subtype 4 TaxID=944170 RepID=UPI0007114536|nr:hypothetical protein JH06_0130 [Blastocystis sp. subtype 4]KNB46523.1 hypothetical protein JH06_0130 [Blastocystis sp. subtype 4]|eukprot:XP_014529966.1 hypothetical protein JH06_0130 [Blastocystis sp. subtype 4]
MTQEEKESFIRFNTLLGEIKDIDASMEQVKKQIQLMDDANEESMLADDEEGNLLLSLGSVFVSMDYTSIEEHLTQLREKGEEELNKLKEEKATMQKELDTIKAKLYARFGDLVVLG